MTNIELIKRIKAVEDHFGQPLFRTRDVIDLSATRDEIMAALEQDRSWFDDIMNETDCMISELLNELKAGD